MVGLGFEIRSLFYYKVVKIYLINDRQKCLDLQRCAARNDGRFFSRGVIIWKGYFGLSPGISSAAAAAKSRQLCPTLCDPIDGSPTGSPVPGIIQARSLEWVAVSFSTV